MHGQKNIKLSRIDLIKSQSWIQERNSNKIVSCKYNGKVGWNYYVLTTTKIPPQMLMQTSIPNLIAPRKL